jgi:vanillate O-demethylase ferredoxin subunit
MESGMEALALELVVAERHEEAQDIVAFALEHPQGGELPAFEAGAHVMVQAAPGLQRAYSLCGDPRERRRYRIGVQREPASRGGSAALHAGLQAGMRLRVGAPRNAFALCEQAGHSILLAGGIGITPLLAMAERLAALRADFALHYCTRSPQRTAFAARLAAPALAPHLRLHHDDGPPAQRFDAASALARPAQGAQDWHVYVCGPAGFIDHAMATAQRLGWPDAQLHREYFSPPATTADGADTAADRPFELVLASSGRRIAVPAGQSAARALQEAGVALAMSCEEGVCGTCVTTVLQGQPAHRDHYLTAQDRARNDCFMPCCSRAHTAQLVIDL